MALLAFLSTPPSSFPPFITMSGLLNGRDKHSTLKHTINHVFLPPKLPQEAEPELLQKEIHLLMCQVALDVVKQVQQNLSPAEQEIWNHLQRTILHIRNTVQIPLAEEQLKRDLFQLPIGGECRSISLIRFFSVTRVFSRFACSEYSLTQCLCDRASIL
jgi:hypothetical protein